jgi:hypothetical protein
VALESALAPVARPFALARGLTARVGLTLVVVGSFAARIVAAAAHPVPRYFPDEYIYTSIARALGSGHAPAVRGAPAHFPALLAPIFAAPLQALFSPEAAYRLTQLENAFLMSVAAVPVYLLARRLSLSTRYALACAVFAVAIPDLVYSSYTLSDPVAYPFVLGAAAAAIVALDRPSRRRQIVFLVLAGLATFARVQYVVLPAAYLVAAVALDRRRVLRTQRLTLIVFVVPVLAALAAGPSRVLGYYSRVAHLHVSTQLLHWASVDLFLLALAAGVVLVPGALVALARPRGRTETAFAAFAAVLTVGLLLEAALYASNGSPRFQERYLFTLLPLVPVAYGLYAKHGRPGRIPVAALSALLLLLAARVPLSGYAAATGKTDSPFLFAVFRLERILGTANGSLVVAALVALAAIGAVLVTRWGGTHIAVGAAIAFAVLASVGASVNDASNAQAIRYSYLPDNPSWVDATGLRNVTLLQTLGSPSDHAIEEMYWNRSITHEARLGGAQPTDVYPDPVVHVAADGTLVGVGSSVLVQAYAATVELANEQPVASAGSWLLWSGAETPRLSLLESGRYSDGWLARSGTLSIWPDATGRVRGVLRFELSLPPNGQPTTVRFGKVHYRVKPGEVTSVTYTIDARGKFVLPFSARKVRGLNDLRIVSALSTPPIFHRVPGDVRPPATQIA